MKIIAQQKHII